MTLICLNPKEHGHSDLGCFIFIQTSVSVWYVCIINGAFSGPNNCCKMTLFRLNGPIHPSHNPLQLIASYHKFSKNQQFGDMLGHRSCIVM